MKQMLSIKRVFLLLLAVGAFNGVMAQTKISTAYTNSPGQTAGFVNFSIPVTPQYITFVVENNNCYPVTFTDMDFLHYIETPLNFPAPIGTINYSNQGAVYTLLREDVTPPGNGAPANIGTNWTIAGYSAPVFAASTGVQPIITGMNVTIGAGEKRRFALVSSDTIMARRAAPSPLPARFTSKKVTLQTVDSNGTDHIIWRIYPNGLEFNAGPGEDFGADMAITFRRKGPTVTVVNNGVCDVDSSKNPMVVDTVTLIATAPPCDTPFLSYNWTGPGGFTASGDTIKIPGHLAKAGKYYVTYTVGGTTDAGTSAPTEVDVIVHPRPEPPVITTKTTYCVGEPFQPVTTDGTNVLWYTTQTGGLGTFIEPYVNTNIPGSYTWYATETVGACESNSRTKVTITVAPVPAPPTVTTPIAYCEHDSPAPLTANGQGLIWYHDPVGGLGSVFAPTFSTSVQDTFNFWVAQKIDGCEGPRSEIEVIITFRPNGLITVSRFPEVCAGDTLSFTYYGSGTPTTAYNWGIPPNASFVSGNGAGPVVIRFDSAGVWDVIMQAHNLTCMSEVFRQTLNIKPIPQAVIHAPVDACANDDRLIELAYYTPTIDTFLWDWNGGITSHVTTDQGPYGVYWTTSGEKVITLTMFDNGCVGETTDTVNVRQLPDASIKGEIFAGSIYDRPDVNDRLHFDNFDFEKDVLCTADSLRFSPNTPVANSHYQWSPVRFFDEYDKLAVSFGRVDFTSPVTLQVTDEFGCINADTVIVNTKPCCEIVFPNAFTPNGDGKNDVFRAITAGFHNTRTFQVFNRWGQKVYEAVDEHRGWDGTLNGEPQDLGTYYYHINFKCDGKYIDQQGEFTLMR